MEYNRKELKNGVYLHTINDNRYKTNYAVVFITLPIKKENITKVALIPEVLKDGSKDIKTNKEISEKLDFMYGASFGYGVDKVGDNVVIKLYIECLDDDFLPEPNNNLEKSINLLLELLFNPQIENEGFNPDFLNIEKEKLAKTIESIRDDKDAFSYSRTINLMYGNNGFGISKYGFLEDLKLINEENLYEEYKDIIAKSKIDFIISGRIKEDVLEKFSNNKYIQNLKGRSPNFIENDCKLEIKKPIEKYNEVKEQDEVTQGKLVMGLDILPNKIEDIRFISIVYNSILGNGVNSKLFQIVREKNGLAYNIKSEYVVQKNNIFIRCGIELKNYNKTRTLIIKLLNDMKNGEFTDEDITKAKDCIIAGIEKIEFEQDSMILFIFAQELSKYKFTLEEYKNNIKNVTREELLEISNSIQINTVYYLEDGGKFGNN